MSQFFCGQTKLFWFHEWKTPTHAQIVQVHKRVIWSVLACLVLWNLNGNCEGSANIFSDSCTCVHFASNCFIRVSSAGDRPKWLRWRYSQRTFWQCRARVRKTPTCSVLTGAAGACKQNGLSCKYLRGCGTLEPRNQSPHCFFHETKVIGKFGWQDQRVFTPFVFSCCNFQTGTDRWTTFKWTRKKKVEISTGVPVPPPSTKIRKRPFHVFTNLRKSSLCIILFPSTLRLYHASSKFNMASARFGYGTKQNNPFAQGFALH